MKIRLYRFKDKEGINWSNQEDLQCSTQGRWAYCGLELWNRAEELTSEDINSELIDFFYDPESHILEELAEVDLGSKFDELDRLFDEGEEYIIDILNGIETQLLLLQSRIKRDSQPLRATLFGFKPLVYVQGEEEEMEEE